MSAPHFGIVGVLLQGTLIVGACAANAPQDSSVVTIAGNGQPGYSGPVSRATDGAIDQPFGLCIGPDGALYVCSVGSHVIRRIDLNSGQMTTVAGCGRPGYAGDGGPATDAELNEPYEVRFDAAGNLVFVEMQNHVVRRVDRESGRISTIAGSAVQGFRGDDGPATAAQLNRPHSITFDDRGVLYICDIGNHRIRTVDPETGIIQTWAGTGKREATTDGAVIAGTPLNGPRALDFDGDHSLYLALREGNSLWRMDLRTQTLHHIAGTGRSGYAGDGGPAVTAELSGPKGISVDTHGDIWFADTESHTIRVVRKDRGIVETVMGDGRKGDGPDGEAAACRLDRPHGVFVSQAGLLYVGDSNNHRVRRLKVFAENAVSRPDPAPDTEKSPTP